MRILLVLFVLSFSTSAFAQENVSDTDLAQLGLGSMQQMSDAEGMEVRGMSSNSQASSFGFFSLFAFDPQTGSSFSANAADFARNTAENAGLNATSTSNSTAGVTGAPFNFATVWQGNPSFSFSTSQFAFGGSSTGTSN